jgi:hypothetical protein
MTAKNVGCQSHTLLGDTQVCRLPHRDIGIGQ